MLWKTSICYQTLKSDKVAGPTPFKFDNFSSENKSFPRKISGEYGNFQINLTAKTLFDVAVNLWYNWIMLHELIFLLLNTTNLQQLIKNSIIYHFENVFIVG